jgi:indole-3-glycerol phosphate synthase
MSDGVVTTGTILDKIIAHSREVVRVAEASRPLNDLKAACQSAPATRNFVDALTREHVALIAEVKHASPSRGILIDPFDPVDIATMYAENGAAAISILTDEEFFKGHLDYLKQIRAAVEIPLLRKDFTIDPYQIYEARDAGADAILLIVATLDDALLADLYALAAELGLAALVEVHDEAEMERAIKLNAKLIGINNRDLRDFSVDLATSARLSEHVPAGAVLVGESGIKTAEDVRALGAVQAILVGETVVTAADRVAKLRELTTVKRKA